MNIEFYEEPHIYTYNGDIAGITVTQLLRRHGLAPDYSGVSSEFLRPYAERGTMIHRELERIAKIYDSAIEPYTEAGVLFKEYCRSNVLDAIPEQVLGINWKGLYICGTADVIGTFKDGITFIADHKTTSTIHVRAVTWQVNIYDYMLRHADEINGVNINWAGADKFLVFHYHGGMKVKELKKIPDSEIEKLFDEELEG